MQIIDTYNDLLRERKNLRRQLKKKNMRYNRLQREIVSHVESINLLTIASKKMYTENIEKIESVVTLAIRYVYNRPLEFKLLLEPKRNNIETRMVVMERGEEFDIEDDEGGGLIDIISFALRIVLWYIREDKTRAFFVFDEPFKWTGAFIEKAGRMMKYFSNELGLQILLISHDNSLIDICDKVYKVVHDGTESKVFLVKRERLRKRRKDGTQQKGRRLRKRYMQTA